MEKKRTIADLLERFDGVAIEQPTLEGFLNSFEQRTERAIPILLREFLLEINGLDFEPVIFHGNREIWCFQSLESIESTFMSFGEFIPSDLFPFAKTNADELIMLSNDNGKVYSLSGYSESQRELRTQIIATSLPEFISEMKNMISKQNFES